MAVYIKIFMMPIFLKIETVLEHPASPAILELIRPGGYDVRMGGHNPCPLRVSYTHVVPKKKNKNNSNNDDFSRGHSVTHDGR
jgi:hypothetical protein